MTAIFVFAYCYDSRWHLDAIASKTSYFEIWDLTAMFNCLTIDFILGAPSALKNHDHVFDTRYHSDICLNVPKNGFQKSGI